MLNDTNLFLKFGGIFEDDPDFRYIHTCIIISNLHLFPMPSSIDDIDEGISLEWYMNPHQLVSVDVHLQEGIAYIAALMNDGEVRGWYEFKGELPPSLIELINRL